jgi:hypothetical protein
MSSSDAVNVDQPPVVPEPKSEVIDQTAEVNQALPAATEQAPAAPVVSVPEEAITAMYETIIAIAKLFNNVDPKEVFNALTAKGVPDFEELKKAFTTQTIVDAKKQRIVLLLLKTDGSDLGNTTFAEFLKLAAPATPVAPDVVSEQSSSSASAPDVSEQPSASSAPAANVSDATPVAATPAPAANVSDATPAPAANVSDATPAPVAAIPAESNTDESIDSDASAPAPAPAPTPAPASNPGGGSKKKRSQTKRKNGHHHHISRNRKARA